MTNTYFYVTIYILYSNRYQFLTIDLSPPTSIAWLRDVMLVLGTQWAMIQTTNSLNTISSLPTWVQLMDHLWAHVPWPCSLDPLLKLACTHPTTIQTA